MSNGFGRELMRVNAQDRNAALERANHRRAVQRRSRMGAIASRIVGTIHRHPVPRPAWERRPVSDVPPTQQLSPTDG